VKASTPLPDQALDHLRKGVELNDGPTRPARVRRLGESEIEISITEGRNRQVRRMIEAAGSSVVELARTKIGTIEIGDLATGKWRELTPAEFAAISSPTRSGTSGRAPAVRPR
jgi:23S rRNA pseudouridine2605 synthase